MVKSIGLGGPRMVRNFAITQKLPGRARLRSLPGPGSGFTVQTLSLGCAPVLLLLGRQARGFASVWGREKR